MNKLFCLALGAMLLFSSCGTEYGSNDSNPAAADHDHAAHAGQAHVECGCSISGIGACGDYVEVDGAMLEIVYPAGVDLGSMPFCGKEGLVADVEGEVVEGKFVASAFALIEQGE